MHVATSFKCLYFRELKRKHAGAKACSFPAAVNSVFVVTQQPPASCTQVCPSVQTHRPDVPTRVGLHRPVRTDAFVPLVAKETARCDYSHQNGCSLMNMEINRQERACLSVLAAWTETSWTALASSHPGRFPRDGEQSWLCFPPGDITADRPVQGGGDSGRPPATICLLPPPCSKTHPHCYEGC